MKPQFSVEKFAAERKRELKGDLGTLLVAELTVLFVAEVCTMVAFFHWAPLERLGDLLVLRAFYAGFFGAFLPAALWTYFLWSDRCRDLRVAIPGILLACVLGLAAAYQQVQLLMNEVGGMPRRDFSTTSAKKP